MGIRTATVVTCDKCKEFVQDNELWIDYGTAGLAFHWGCIASMSAMEFIYVAHEGGDQMFVRDSLESNEPYAAELKHLSWGIDGRNLKNILAAYRISK